MSSWDRIFPANHKAERLAVIREHCDAYDAAKATDTEAADAGRVMREDRKRSRVRPSRRKRRAIKRAREARAAEIAANSGREAEFVAEIARERSYRKANPYSPPATATRGAREIRNIVYKR